MRAQGCFSSGKWPLEFLEALNVQQACSRLCFFLPEKTALDFMKALNTGVLNAGVFLQGKLGPGFLEALNV